MIFLLRNSVTYPVINTDYRNGEKCRFPHCCLEPLYTPKFMNMQEIFLSLLGREAQPLQPWGRGALARSHPMWPVSSGHIELNAMEGSLFFEL